ncbi:YceI family protein [Domibacillus sp. PGB-M46]|uniref:YceI family protein n=1 Tax=Domibacillus sp. PGB-M46 TaxID=2910255 RepID=UPI001F56EDFF|nr:YceI family protein [Domibacillus sp. PGB-M46]MCI2252755.1 YceI family protein [Domibacillus sp. PGB-M46]
MDKPTWVVDKSQSQVYAAVNHVKGSFPSYEATVEAEADHFVTANISFNVELSTIQTGNKELDAHLVSEKFFDVEKYAEVRFIANNILDQENGQYELVGDLSLHGVTRTESFFVTFHEKQNSETGETARFQAKAVIKRSDYGLTLETGGVHIEDDVKIVLDLQLVKAA